MFASKTPGEGESSWLPPCIRRRKENEKKVGTPFVPTVLLSFVPVQLGCGGVGKKTPSARDLHDGGLRGKAEECGGKKTPSTHDSRDGGVGGRQRGVVIGSKPPLLAFRATRGLVDGGWWMYATTALLMS